MLENDRVKEVRKAKGLTLERFGEKVGVQKSAVSKIERGENAVSDQIRLAICREFNVSEIWLRTGEGDMFAQRPEKDELADTVEKLITGESAEFKRRLITALSSLNDEHWILLEKKLKEIAGEGKASEHLNVPEQEQPEPDYEAEARAEAELFYQQRLLEKQRESQAQSAKESGTA